MLEIKMFNRLKVKNKNFKQGDILIRPSADIDEDYEIGRWNEYYPFLKMIYNANDNKNTNFSYVLLKNRTIFGYFLASNIVNINENPFVDLYSRKLILHDLGIYSNSYAKYGKLLVDYIINLARNCYCKVIEIRNVDGFDYFYNFLKRNYKIKEFDNSYYIIINNPKYYPNERNLKIFNDDIISLENLYFLYGLNFRIYRHKCIYVLKGKTLLTIDRKTNEITFPSNVICENKKILLNNKTRNLIHMLCYMYKNNCVKEVCVNTMVDFIDAVFNNTAIMFENSYNIISNYSLLNKIKVSYGYDYIYTYKVDFDYNEMFYREDINMVEIREYLKRRNKYLDLKGLSMKEIGQKLKEAEIFNKQLENIKRFDFRMGNSFSGIKKFTIIFDKEIEIKHNGEKNDLYEKKLVEREFIINELKQFYFSNWKDKYENLKPNYDNAWTISLVFEGKMINYQGLDEYPNVWLFVIEFIEKYSTLKI